MKGGTILGILFLTTVFLVVLGLIIRDALLFFVAGSRCKRLRARASRRSRPARHRQSSSRRKSPPATSPS